MAQDPFIICDNLIKIYKIAELEIIALQGLDLTIAPGELLGIVGVSGSGKSTLLNVLGGLDRPTAGRVWVGGQDLLGMSNGALSRYRQTSVGFVWQQTSRNLVPYLNAQENVELPMTLAGKTGAQKREWAAHLLETVGLADRRHHRLSELSGGEQQRVAIAVALANKPILLLADEPTGEVDTATALTIYETIQRLNQEMHLTTLIVSHDPGIARHVNRVVRIRDGRLAAETLRQYRAQREAGGADGQEAAAGETEEFEELIVLDSVGRLQIPRSYLEQFDMRGRVYVEPQEEGILIRPAANTDHVENAEKLVEDLVQAQKAQRGFRGMWRRWRHKDQGDAET